MLKKIVGAIAVVVVLGAVWFFTQGPGVAMLHKSEPPMDVGSAPAPQPESAQPAPQQPEPMAAQPAPMQEPATSGSEDASQNRGMKFLLNQGKQ